MRSAVVFMSYRTRPSFAAGSAIAVNTARLPAALQQVPRLCLVPPDRAIFAKLLIAHFGAENEGNQDTEAALPADHHRGGRPAASSPGMSVAKMRTYDQPARSWLGPQPQHHTN